VGWLLLLAYAGLYSHVFLDYLNNYGVRLLTPIDWRWFYGDSLFIIDLWLWLAFGIGTWLSRRRTSARPARWALTLAVCYIAAMVVTTRTARVIVADAWRARAGTEPRALMVGPRAITPFTRDVIVDAGDRYEGGSFDWVTREVQWEPMAIPKNEQLPEVVAARGEAAVQAFLVWSRFPFWEIDRVAGGTRVTVRDARFVAAGRGFAASTVVPAPAPAGLNVFPKKSFLAESSPRTLAPWHPAGLGKWSSVEIRARRVRRDFAASDP
jgi:inner membrane protein